jgi:CheY-like chemotaxis protein
MGNYVDIPQFYLLNEIWLYNITNQVYLITLLMVFSLVAYLFIKNRSGDSFALSSSEQYHFLNTITRYSETADMIVDNQGIIRFANDQFLDLFSLGDEIDNKAVQEINLPGELKDKVFENNSDFTDFSFTISGSIHGVKLAPVTTEDGQLIGKLVKVQDPNRKGSAEAETGTVMHEINTPLNAIMGFSELLADEENLTEIQKEYLNIISDHSQILKERINRLLNDHGNNGFYKKNNYKNRSVEKILIVDDVAINRTLLKIILKRYGFEVFEAENGNEAVEIFKAKDCDLILMDLSMPVMDGMEATDIIRKLNYENSNIPIIAVTASSRYKNSKTLEEKGFNALLRKPFKEKELIELLRKFEVN